MGGCSILGCKSRTERKDENVTFHSFPKDINLRKVWIEATGRQNWQPNKSSKICSIHFNNDAIDIVNKAKRIKPEAIPVKHVHAPVVSSDQMETISVVPSTSSGVVHSSQDFIRDQIQPISEPVTTPTKKMKHKTISPRIPRKKQCMAPVVSSDQMETISVVPSTSSGVVHSSQDFIRDQIQPISEPVTTPTKKRKHKTISPRIPRKKLCMTAPSTPRKEKLLKLKLQRSKELSTKRLLKLRAMREAKRRLIRKNAHLQSILTELQCKMKINSEDLDLLANIDKTNADFLKRMVGKKICPRKYSSSLRKFALCLHFISPKAYNFVRNQFDTCLPHPKTLYRWYCCIDCEPGFTTEAFEALKLLTKRSTEKIICALSLDEMSIRQHVQWDGKKSVGYVNIGNNLEIHRPLAKDALVFMVTGINGRWKLPIGYFFTNGVNGEQRSALLKNCISLLNDCSIVVSSVTFDGCPANFAMAKYLGAKLDSLNNLDPKITVEGQTFVIFPDPCHMIKLVRNCLAEKKNILDGNGVISWQYIEKLHSLQEAEGLHLGNKLRKSHIEFKKQIMKVRLAAQTFSKSVADSLSFLKDVLKLQEFVGASATINFVTQLNNIFDILNSRKLYSYKFKKPISKENFPIINSYFQQFETYLNRLHFKDGELVLTSGRKTGFIGLLICIKALQIIYENLILSGNLKYLPTYKLSQDHLELFFSAIRSKGGFNNNPTAKQFQSAYKRLLIHGELKNISTGNCIPLDSINILNCNKSALDRRINNTRNRLISIDDADDEMVNLCVPEDIDVPATHDYLVNNNLTEFSIEVTKYIAGFIVSKMFKIIKCGECLASLISFEKYSGLISHKDVGGLHYPSEDVVNICLYAEKILRSFLAEHGPSFLAKEKVMPKMILIVQKKFVGKPLFPSLREHISEQSPFDNHLILLLKAIAYRYFEVRIHFVNKSISNQNEKIRNFHNKLVLFKGQ